VRCPSAKRLAAASLGADVRAELHAETCDHCRAELAAMTEVGAFVRRAPVRVPTAERRARIAALVMASSDAAEPMRARALRSRLPMALVTITALAAVAALVAWRAHPTPAEYAVAWPQLPRVVSPPPVAQEIRPSVAPVIAPTPAPPVAHHIAPTPPARVTPHAATTTTRVFAGSQERTRDGQLTRDQVTLEPGPIVARVVEPTAFERGWTALREGRFADAIAAFDQVNNVAVTEDAAYWAAIASARSGDHSDAARRLSAFVAKFPTSARLAEARALLARVAP
jgi:hypothetical protein